MRFVNAGVLPERRIAALREIISVMRARLGPRVTVGTSFYQEVTDGLADSLDAIERVLRYADARRDGALRRVLLEDESVE